MHTKQNTKKAVVLKSGEMSEQFEQFVATKELGSIHQIEAWGQFQTLTAGRDKYWRIVVMKGADQKIVASALIVKQSLPMGKCWLYAPRGPVMDFEDEVEALENLKLLEKAVREIAAQEKAVFWRIDPALKKEAGKWGKVFADFKSAHAHYQPECTLILDLSLSKEELLAQMKPKGRYNIKVAVKNGVTVEAPTLTLPREREREDGIGSLTGERERGDDGVEWAVGEYYRLLEETTARDGFSGHGAKYYQNMLQILGPARAKMYLAKYQGEVIAGMIATFFGETAIYYFGASGNKHRNVMAPYLLQWTAIEEAKDKGFKHYDFLGIAPDDNPKHPWAGVTEFKNKFGGQKIDYLEAKELVFRPLDYWLIVTIKKLKGLLRGRN